MLIPHSKPTIHADDINAVTKVLKQEQLSQGDVVYRFEEALADYVGVKGAVAVNSGCAALYLALQVLGVKKGCEVIVPTYTCSALGYAVEMTGATIRLVDVDGVTGNIDPQGIAKVINKKTVAIIVPHMFGCPADMRALKKCGIPIVEDCAQALGATYRGKKVGAWGDIAIGSFYATKMMATGEGGVVWVKSKRLQKEIQQRRDYDHQAVWAPRFNFKMTEMQAALGLSQLAKIDYFVRIRRHIASVYDQSLKGTAIDLPEPQDGQSYYRYACRLRSGSINQFLNVMKQKGVICARPVYRPLHEYLKRKSFPQADQLQKKTISLPIYPTLTKKQQNKIIRAVLTTLG